MAASDGNAGSGDANNPARPASGQRRKPAPITIDLAASSVSYANEAEKASSEGVDAQAAAAAPAEAKIQPKSPDASTEPAAASAPSPAHPPEETSPATPEPEMASAETVKPSEHPEETVRAKPETAPAAETATHASAEPSRPPAGNGDGKPARPHLIAACLIGGAIGLAASYGLALAGFWPGGDTSAVNAELAALKTRIAATESRVAPNGPLASELDHLKSLPSIPGVTIADVEKILDPFTTRTNAAVAHMDEIDRRLAGEQAVIRGQVKASQEALAARMAGLDAGASANAAATKQLTDTVAKLREDLGALDKKSGDDLASAKGDIEKSLSKLGNDLDDLAKRTAADLAIVRGSETETNAHVGKLEAAVGAAATDASDLHKTIDGLAGRLGAVDDVKAILSQQTAKLANADEAKKAADGVVASLWIIDQRIANLQAKLTDLEALKAAVSTSDKTLATVQSRLGPVETRLADIDRYSKQGVDARKQAIAAVAIANLRAAADSGRPFAAELATAKTIAGSTVDLGALDAYAAKGLVPEARIVDGFDAASRAILESGPRADGAGGVIGALISHATSSVKIVPANAEAGDTLDAHVSRIAGRLKAHDLAGALAEWQALPDTARAAKVSADWGAALKTHVDGQKAVAAIADQVMTKLTAASE